MLPMKYIFYSIFVHCILALPQINLYFTNNQSTGNQHTCFRLASNVEHASLTRHISSYCLTEPPFNFHILNDHSSSLLSFAQLATMNITSEDLYLWSTPIDIVEHYQIYLHTKDVSLGKEIYYNCTLPRFGPMCEYELYYYHANYSSLYEVIHGYYEEYADMVINMTCYRHLKCVRGYAPACLDWTEICDGKVDCLDGEFDEEHCWQLEFSECEPNEYRCRIGQCIPQEFVRDDETTFECVDRSDEKMQDLDEFSVDMLNEPAFGYDDVRCNTTFLTKSCSIHRHRLLSEAMFSVKDESISYVCWQAFKCYLGFPYPNHPGEDYDDHSECITAIHKTCPDMFYAPNVPTFFGYIYTAYKNDDALSIDNYILPYLCSNKSFNYGSLDIVLDRPMNTTTCFKISQFRETSSELGYDWQYRYHIPMNDIYEQLQNIGSIINFPRNRCNESTIYQCQNSSKCISLHRLLDDVYDCPYHDDENISRHSNDRLFAQMYHKYYKCHFTNKYISRAAISNGRCDCGYLENNFCEDEDKEENYTRRTISFQTMCDDFRELSTIMINGRNHSDEDECEQWECDNVYTRCDGIWNCFDGRDELDCDSSSLSLFRCSSDSRICVTLNTSELSCLPVKQVNDGKVDCLGGTDERRLCRSISHTYSLDGGFYCKTNSTFTCFHVVHLCNRKKDCSSGDDEQFCHKNRTVSQYNGLCHADYQPFTSDVEKVLCKTSKRHQKAKVKQFTINGFYESLENKINHNRHIHTITIDRYRPIALLDQARCNRGLDLRVWLNKSANLYTSICLCPPSYYGNQCQFQNQRISLAIRFHVPAQARQTLFAILVMLIDDSPQRTIHSFEQFTYLSIRDCQTKINLYLLYATRPKHANRTYSIHIDIFDKHSLVHRSSLVHPVKFSFLPVHRLALIVNIPSDNSPAQTCPSDNICVHGTCITYLTTKQTFCRCHAGWSGEQCDIAHRCDCSVHSVCVGFSSDNRSICVCRENYFGSRCYVRSPVCSSSPCENNGVCVSHDDFMLSSMNPQYFCICPKGFSGSRCQFIDTRIDLMFESDIRLSHSVFVHFIRIVQHDPADDIFKPSPQRSTILQTISQATHSLRVYWSHPFHLTFIETLDKTFYLVVLQPVYNHSLTITRHIRRSHRCPSISELVNDTVARLHLVRRMKSYHVICQAYSPHLQCFRDDVHLCLCYHHRNKRLANCFRFDHEMKFDCFGRNHCENDGQCFQDSADCPTRSICVCRSCHYGSRCQFSTSGFGLSLDAILAYHIIPDVDIFHQTSIVKVSFALTILFMIVGLINGVLSLITFNNKNVLEVGCGIYLLGSSITTLLTMTLFGMKYFVYLSTQISTWQNRVLLEAQCHSLDFVLRICVNMDQWLDACVSMERAMTAIQGAAFMKAKSKQLAKRLVVVVFILIISTSIHDPIHRRIFEEKNDYDDGKIRISCIVECSPTVETYDRVVNTLNFFVPFLINFISSLILIAKKTQQKVRFNKDQNSKAVFGKQIVGHQRLLIAPVVLFLLALPRLVLSYSKICMNSAKDSWLFLSGYFLSFIPTMITFLIFVLPSEFYTKECKKFFRKRLNSISPLSQ
ncbi:unnamed protein product [Adineta ricciae]|uniref:Uncharacterized protein n=2 Tax=Adineta ricciae TaxID=249248 RepID=A0A814ELX7_ADIRI|nr:unnamed protein product [Adineta ricciae]